MMSSCAKKIDCTKARLYYQLWQDAEQDANDCYLTKSECEENTDPFLYEFEE